MSPNRSKREVRSRSRQQLREQLIAQTVWAVANGKQTPVGAFSIKAAAAFSGHGEATLNREIAHGNLESYVAGGRRYVFAHDLVLWMEGLKTMSDAGKPAVFSERGVTVHMPANNRSKRGRPRKPRPVPVLDPEGAEG